MRALAPPAGFEPAPETLEESCPIQLGDGGELLPVNRRGKPD